MLTALALLSLVALGGFISYYGDLQGRRWGKRRVSWFGMRPKHTAILITSLTGSFLVILSIITVLAIVPPVRNIIIHGEWAIHENRRLLASLREQRAQNAAELAQAVQQRTENATELARLAQQLQLVNGRTYQKQRQLNTVTALFTAAARRLQESTSRVSLLQTTKSKLDAAIARSYRQQNELEGQNREYARQNEDTARQNLQLARETARLKSALPALQRQIAEQQDKLKGLIHDRDALDRSNQVEMQANREREQQLTTRVMQLEAQIQQAQDRLAGLNDTYRQYTENVIAFRQGTLALPHGVELARRTIEDHRTPDYVARELHELLRDAQAAASQHGARAGEDGRLVQVLAAPTVSQAHLEDTGEEATIRALADSLAAADKPVVVQATVASNAFAGEPVLVSLVPTAISSDVVFRSGETIAKRTVDARQSPEKVADELLAFLHTDVKEAALRARMVPRVDPYTREEEVGTVGTEQFAGLHWDVMHRGGIVEVAAIAKNAIHAGDPLDLRFRVTRARRSAAVSRSGSATDPAALQ